MSQEFKISEKIDPEVQKNVANDSNNLAEFIIEYLDILSQTRCFVKF